MDRKWTAKWITCADFMYAKPIDVFYSQQDDSRRDKRDAYTGPVNHHQMFRRTFELARKPRHVIAYISADDFYKLYINGRYVCMGPASAYYFHYNYNVVDVADYLLQGENLIAVEVLYQGLYNRVGNSADMREGMIIELNDGNETLICSDDRWLTKQMNCYEEAPLAGYATQMQDYINSNNALTGWNTNPKLPAVGWDTACVKLFDDHKLYRQITPVTANYMKKPEQIWYLSSGGVVLDFGGEITASLYLRVKDAKNDRIEILYGEELNEDGKTVRYKVRCIKQFYRDEWTLSGGEDAFEPFEYKAFRYVELHYIQYSGENEAEDIDAAAQSLSAVVRHYPFSYENISFKSSNKQLEKIWGICQNAVQYGVQDRYLDCPSREKGQYLGDAVITSHSHFLLTGDARIFKKCLMDFALSAYVCKGLMAVAPGSVMQEIADYSLLYPYMVQNYVRLTGDKAILRELLPVIKDMLSWFCGHMRVDKLLCNVNEKWNLVDWPDTVRDGYDFPLTQPGTDGCHNVINALWYGAVKTYESLLREAEDAGIPVAGMTLKEVSSEMIASSFHKAFYSPETGLFTDTEASQHSALHSNVFPLFYGMTNREEEPRIVGFIRKKRFACSPYIAYFILIALCEHGFNELAYDLVTCEDEHSWANMLREGASTCFEAWGKDQKWNTSLCHPWSSAPIVFITEYLAGIRPADAVAGLYHAAPSMPASLKRFRLSVPVPGGKITVFCSAKKGTEINAAKNIKIAKI